MGRFMARAELLKGSMLVMVVIVSLLVEVQALKVLTPVPSLYCAMMLFVVVSGAARLTP